MSFVLVSNASKAYEGIPALDDFSFEIEQGETVALVGPDGAGKTTLIRILCNLVSPDKGTAYIDGKDVNGRFDEIKLLLGYMPQTFSLYSDLSVEENLRFYAGIYGYSGESFRRKRDKLYRFSQLGPFSDRRAGALSGGMKQKLALSCALLHDPRLLVLDEPTTGVDPLSRRYFWEMLLELKGEGVTILVSTPYMDEAERSDRTCCIFGGRKLAEGTPDELARLFRGSIYYLDREPTTRLVRRVSELDGLSARRFGTGMHLYVEAGRRIESFAETLGGLGLDTTALSPVVPSIEDSFIQLMGETP
jgi:ABC-2 type transport system ATP-binding protein